jgi:TonB family protein
VDLGQVRGISFVAYDYVSGKTLAELLEQASKRQFPIPLDHALLISERLALALAVAYETRIEEERVLHGFTVPSLVFVSHEGEVRMSGFEVAAGLRASVSHPLIKEAFGRYLSPEALAGQPIHKSDDVYSLGAVLYELLTGQRLPASTPSHMPSIIDQAVIAADGGNLHPDLANLLKKSLAPREQRIADVVTWHKALSKLMFDGQYNPTTFNLAFFMHNLFREEIEVETQEIEKEKTIPIPTSPAPEAAAAAAPAAGAVREDTQVLLERYGIEKEKKSPAGLIAAAVVGVAVVGGAIYFLTAGRSSEPIEVAPPAPTAPPVPAGPSPEEIEAQIEKILQERMKSQEAQVQQQLQQQIQALQKQLEDARRQQQEAARSAAVPPQPTPAPPSVQPQTVAQLAAESRPALSEPLPTPTLPPLRQEVVASPTPTPAPVTPTAPPPAATPMPTSVAAAPAATPAAPQAGGTRPGEIVSPGPGVTAPKRIQSPPLDYPPIAKRMKREAEVVIRVLVDEGGRPIQVELAGPKVGLGFDEAALENVRKTKFAPATKNGVPVKMWMELKISFKL